MRIALVASLVGPIRPAAANGPHSVILDLARGLGARGHEIVVFAARGSVARGVAIREIDVDPIAQGAAIQADGGEAPAAAKAALARGFDRLFDEVRRFAPDAVSQHAFDAPAIRLAEDLPVLHTLHLPPIDLDVVAAARATDKPLATVSNAASKVWQAAGVNGVGVIRNGVPDFGVSSSKPSRVALIAGRISPEKGTATAIRVARRAGLTPLVLGDVYDRRYFREQVEPILKKGEFAGPVSRRLLSGMMASSAVLLMPIEWDEPFGLVAAEAQMCGCPVVGYRRGALPEVVVDGLGGFLAEPGHEDELVSAIAGARQLDRSAIRMRAQRDLGVVRMVDEYEAALASICGESARLPAVDGQHLERTGLDPGHARRATRHTRQGDPVEVASTRK